MYGGIGPGDGFTAGVTIGLAISLWYIVLGYDEAKRQLPWFRPEIITRLGLVIAIVNAAIPVLLGKGFMGHVQYDKVLGIYELSGLWPEHSSLRFEIASITVRARLGIIMERSLPAAAHPDGDTRQKLSSDELSAARARSCKFSLYAERTSR